jgi:anti-sigma regulatory factor (Ser/Thr protein kinase)
MPTTAAVPLIAWSRTFPGTPEQVREARRFLADILAGQPATGDALLCLSELVSNAVLHSHSGKPGGQFSVRVEMNENLLRIEVLDGGGLWAGAGAPDEQHGRGLNIVSQLAVAWGRDGDSETGWTVWYELGTPASGAAADEKP